MTRSYLASHTTACLKACNGDPTRALVLAVTIMRRQLIEAGALKP